jgi:hypothetical protein
MKDLQGDMGHACEEALLGCYLTFSRLNATYFLYQVSERGANGVLIHIVQQFRQDCDLTLADYLNNRSPVNAAMLNEIPEKIKQAAADEPVAEETTAKKRRTSSSRKTALLPSAAESVPESPASPELPDPNSEEERRATIDQGALFDSATLAFIRSSSRNSDVERSASVMCHSYALSHCCNQCTQHVSAATIICTAAVPVYW